MKAFLEKLIKRKRDEIAELQKRSDASEDIKEVRDIGVQITQIRNEINEAEEQLRNLDKPKEPKDNPEDNPEDNPDEPDTRDNIPPANAKFRGLKPLKSYKTENRDDDPTNSIEYRKAFMEFACRNVPIPAELRANATTTTSDAAAVIPTTILNEIIQKAESYGNIYAKVRKLNVQGGVEIPILSLKPEAKWITESKSSDDQKIQANTKISFSYHGLEVKIAQSLLVNITALDMFEKTFIPLGTEALIKAIEKSIFAGTGSGQPLGIISDSRIPAENIIEISESDFTWKNLKKKIFAKIKKAYRNGEFIMAQSTFDGYIDGMTDTAGQPIGRVNYGIEGEEKYRFGGKTVETVEDEIIPGFDSASPGDVVAVFTNLSDYGINSNMQMTLTHWADNDNNVIKDKLMLIIDGKLIDPNGTLIIKKKATTSGT